MTQRSAVISASVRECDGWLVHLRDMLIIADEKERPKVLEEVNWWLDRRLEASERGDLT